MRALNLLDLLSRQLDTNGLHIVLQMLHLPAADDGEDVWGLLHDVRKSDSGNGELELFGNLVENHSDLLLGLCRSAEVTAGVTIFLLCGSLAMKIHHHV